MWHLGRVSTFNCAGVELGYRPMHLSTSSLPASKAVSKQPLLEGQSQGQPRRESTTSREKVMPG